MRLPDFPRSRAVLIGTATYDGTLLPHLPMVASNVAALCERLTDPTRSGFAVEHCMSIVDPMTCGDLLEPVQQAAEQAEDTLLVYFAGHGLLDREGELHLGLATTHPEKPWTSVRFEDLAAVILASDAQAKIVILDCCYGGRAMKHMHMGVDSDPVAESMVKLDVEGLYVLTSSSGNKASLAPEGEDFTAFTGQVLRLIDTGVADGGRYLTMENVYSHVRREMGRARRPKPQQHSRNNAGRMALVRNIAAPPGLDQRLHATGVRQFVTWPEGSSTRWDYVPIREKAAPPEPPAAPTPTEPPERASRSRRANRSLSRRTRALAIGLTTILILALGTITWWALAGERDLVSYIGVGAVAPIRLEHPADWSRYQPTEQSVLFSSVDVQALFSGQPEPWPAVRTNSLTSAEPVAGAYVRIGAVIDLPDVEALRAQAEASLGGQPRSRITWQDGVDDGTIGGSPARIVTGVIRPPDGTNALHLRAHTARVRGGGPRMVQIIVFAGENRFDDEGQPFDQLLNSVRFE